MPKASKPLEKTIEAAIVKYANAKGMMCKKLQTGIGGSAGWPDRMFIAKSGKLFFIEFKREGGKLSDWQELLIHQLRAHKQLVYVVDNVIYGKEVIDEYAAKDS